MCSGSTVHYLNSNRVELKTGELLILSQNVKQEILPASVNDIGINFIILPEFFSSTLPMIKTENSVLSDFLVNCICNSEDSGYFHFKVSDIIPIQNLIKNMIWTLLYQKNNSYNIIQLSMALLFIMLGDYTDRVNTADNSIAYKVLQYIDTNFQNGTLNELAKELHYDANWLSKEIKELTGSTYTKLVQEKRLKHACFLLKSTNMSIDNIIHAVGYDNTGYFHRIFINEFGISPKNYRKQKSSSGLNLNEK